MRPDIYIFNSTCEMAVANGVFSYMPPKRFREMEQSLETLPSFFAQDKDIVIVSNPINEEWINKMQECGFRIPIFATMESIQNTDIGFLRPWGWSPAQHHFFKNLKKKCSKTFINTVNSEWSESYQELYSRITAREILKYLLQDNPLEIFPKIEEIPTVCESIEEVKKLVANSERILLKSPWSSSGRGLYLLEEKLVTKVNEQWISGVLNNQKYVMAEIWKNKICDFSFQYYLDEKSEVHSVGITSFLTDTKGNYIGTNLCFSSIYDNNNYLKNFLNIDIINQLDNKIKSAIKLSKISTSYYGFFGVDCMVYEENGNYKIQPCVEINLRYNMGLLSLKIKEQLHNNCFGHVSTIYVRDISKFLKEMSSRFPAIIMNNKLQKGFLPITNPSKNSSFITFILLY